MAEGGLGAEAGRLTAGAIDVIAGEFRSRRDRLYRQRRCSFRKTGFLEAKIHNTSILEVRNSYLDSEYEYSN